MINGAHMVIYSKNAEADRAFFRDVLALPNVDAGHGWPIFAMPPLEAAFHGYGDSDRHELYLMCDDIASTLDDLKFEEGSGHAGHRPALGKSRFLHAAGRREDRHL